MPVAIPPSALNAIFSVFLHQLGLLISSLIVAKVSCKSSLSIEETMSDNLPTISYISSLFLGETVIIFVELPETSPV